MKQPSPLRIEPLAGYSAAIGQLVGMLSYARSTTLAAVAGLTTAQLDHLQDPASTPIGALPAHWAAVDSSYQILTFEGGPLSPEETARLAPALGLGPDGQRALRGCPLPHSVDELAAPRGGTLEAL